jgi:hypothetical protein
MADADDYREEPGEEEEVEKGAGGLVTRGVIGAGMGGGGLPSTLGGALAGQIVAEEVIDKEMDADRGEGPADIKDAEEEERQEP